VLLPLTAFVGGFEAREHIAMSHGIDAAVSTIGIDTGKTRCTWSGWMTRGQLFCVRGLFEAGLGPGSRMCRGA
jgi:hypothetical protein